MGLGFYLSKQPQPTDIICFFNTRREIPVLGLAT